MEQIQEIKPLETCNNCRGEGKLRDQPKVKVPFIVPKQVKAAGIIVGATMFGMVFPGFLVRLMCLLNGIEYGDGGRVAAALLGGLLCIFLAGITFEHLVTDGEWKNL